MIKCVQPQAKIDNVFICVPIFSGVIACPSFPLLHFSCWPALRRANADGFSPGSSEKAPGHGASRGQ